MSNIVTFAGSNLPTVASLSESLRKLETTAGLVGIAILKMDRTGHWVFGADQTEVEDDTRWAVNPFSFVKGFIAWGDGEVLGEKMVPVGAEEPELDAAPPGAKKGWEPQVGISLKCLSGQDNGLEVRFTTTSVGGRRAVHDLAMSIKHQIDKVDESKPVPVVYLKNAHYQHKSYGKIFTPMFESVEWVSMDAKAEQAATPVPATQLEAPVAGRRRRVAA